MFREIKTSERNMDNFKEYNQKSYGYLKIKPEHEMTIEEMNTMMMDILTEASERA